MRDHFNNDDDKVGWESMIVPASVACQLVAGALVCASGDVFTGIIMLGWGLTACFVQGAVHCNNDTAQYAPV